VALIVSACGDDGAPTSDPPPAYAAAWQQIVDDLRSLQNSQGLPNRLLDPEPSLDGTGFDIEDYFTVFEHIDAEPGFVLDYVYRATPDRGFPVLHIRRADQPGHATYDEYPAATGSDDASQGDTAYLDQIYVIDGTPKGFFEYVTLRVMGGQFYLFWHAQEMDAQVVATRERLDDLLDSVAELMDDTQLERGRAADPSPMVSFEGDIATVEILVFTRWGGLHRHTYTIERVFPQQILNLQVETVAACDCGYTF
jgi:hypothetical protein